MKFKKLVCIFTSVILSAMFFSCSKNNSETSLSTEKDAVSSSENTGSSSLTNSSSPSSSEKSVSQISSESSENQKSKIKNVIILIGDGMGFSHLEWTKQYFGLDSLTMESLPEQKEATTYSLNDTITDSAASGTAMATGYKTNNGQVDMIDDAVVPNIMRYSHAAGKKTGIITTDDIYGATPAAFSSNAPSRSDYTDILESQCSSNIDLFVGGVVDSNRTQYMSNEIRGRGYHYVETEEELYASGDNSKIFATLDTLHSDYVSSDYTELSDIADFATSYLDNEKGFTLMIEGARIDKFSHANDLEGMVHEAIDFDETVRACLEFAESRDDTALIVTADHESGGITDVYDGNYQFTLTSHSAQRVPFLAYGIDLNKDCYDNTDVFNIAYSLVTTGEYSDVHDEKKDVPDPAIVFDKTKGKQFYQAQVANSLCGNFKNDSVAPDNYSASTKAAMDGDYLENITDTVTYTIYAEEDCAVGLSLNVTANEYVSEAFTLSVNNLDVSTRDVKGKGCWNLGFCENHFGSAVLYKGMNKIEVKRVNGGYNLDYLALMPVTYLEEDSPVRIEAEEASGVDGRLYSSSAASGGALVDYIDGSLYFTVYSSKEEDRTLTIGYACGQEGGQTEAFSIKVNSGDYVNQDIACTGGWTAFSEMSVSVHLAQGINRIGICKSNGQYNLDYIEL